MPAHCGARIFSAFLACLILSACGGSGSGTGSSTSSGSPGGAPGGTSGQAIPTPAIYQNPFMAPNNFSEIHLNVFQTDTGSVAGPARQSGLAVGQIPVAITDSTGIAGSINFNAQGQIITVRTAPVLSNGDVVISQTLMLIDPVSSQILSRLSLPTGPKSTNGVSFSGGGYFYLNNLDEAVFVTFDQNINIYKVVNNQFVLDTTYALASAINDPNAELNSVLPDNAGNLWFITNTGTVGYINTTCFYSVSNRTLC